jgi:two-component system, LytTR family, response regulator
MKTYKCFILDDEPLALHVIEQHLSKFSQFRVCGKSTDPIEGLELIKSLHPDLLFIDIEMPEINGLELIQSLQHKPEIIITTAYREFAVEGFELNVLDYLVKPVPFKRFVKAIEKFLEQKAVTITTPDSTEVDHLFVKADRKTMRIELDDILYIEGVKDYVKIVLKQQNIITKTSIGNFLKELPADRFIQVHKSFIVAKNKIKAYTAHDIEIGGIEIPIGRVYKESFINEVKGQEM